MTKDTTTVGLYITTRREGDYFHVCARAVTVGATASDRAFSIEVAERAIRNPGDALVRGLRLKDLTVWSQGENAAVTRRLYGWQVEYRDVFGVDRMSAVAMAKTLTAVERRMDKLAERVGRPATYGQYLAHVAAALGATTFVFLRGKAQGWSYSMSDHELLPVGEGVARVDHLVDEWVRERDAAVAAS